jgi:acyl-CoA thioester hydrolase
MRDPCPLTPHRATVLPEWVDYNGHMSEAFYVLVFGHATDAFLDHIGMDDAARRAGGSSLYTVEAHIRYLREAHEGEGLHVLTQLLGHDDKRIHLHHAMLRQADERQLATTELLLLHVDRASARVAPMPPAPRAAVAALAAAHRALPRPDHVGHVITLTPRQTAQTRAPVPP